MLGLVAVQLARAQPTPRIITLVYRNRVLRLSLTFFVFSFTCALAVLSRIDEAVPQISMWVANYGSVASIALFVYMIDHVGKSLRPVSLLTAVGSAGQEVIREVYPRPLEGVEDTPTKVALLPRAEPSRTVAGRQLDTGRVHDAGGELRLADRTPDRDDFVSLSVTEIRHFGRESIQIVRRMRTMLENLAKVVPPQRVALLRAELELLGRGVGHDSRDPEDRLRAASADTLGVGGAT
jgi:uncharacterized membrane protein